MKNKLFNYAIGILTMIGLVCLGLMVNLYFSAEKVPSELVKFQFEILQIILVSVVIGLLGILIPDKLAQKKHDEEIKKQSFELLCEGRRLYSIVKTGLDYLPYTLSGMSHAEALIHLEKIHQAYHLVMLYPDDENLKGMSYIAFFEKYKAFNKLESTREILFEAVYQISDLNKKYDMLRSIQNQFKT